MDPTNEEGELRECPQGEMCKWRSHPHFKRYTHAHLNRILENPSSIPETLPLHKDIYLKQIEVMISLNPKNSIQDTHIMDEDEVELINNLKNLMSDTEVTVEENPNVTMLEKLNNAAPYNIFFNRIVASEATYEEPNVITFTDLLCPSLGSLKSSLQINFILDILWLMEQYRARNLHRKPLTIVHGFKKSQMPDAAIHLLRNVTSEYVELKDNGITHSKIGIYLYEDDSLRVSISSANLYYVDWNKYNNGTWLSPSCPRLKPGSTKDDGESPTEFKKSLLTYLKHYSRSCLRKWIDCVEKADFSAVRVFLVTSVPGPHLPQHSGSHLYRVSNLLSKHCSLPAKTSPDCEAPDSWHILAQSSTVGGVGNSPPGWIKTTLLRSLSSQKDSELPVNPNVTLSVVYPSFANVVDGYEGIDSGGCLGLYNYHDWFHTYLHQWKADKLQRTKAMPHIKTFCRISPCLTRLSWFLLTSANISQSAWGSFIKKDSSISVRNYEAGVMFFPEFFDEEYFEIRNTPNMRNQQLFPFIYDLPLVPYRVEDFPWARDEERNLVTFE